MTGPTLKQMLEEIAASSPQFDVADRALTRARRRRRIVVRTRVAAALVLVATLGLVFTQLPQTRPGGSVTDGSVGWLPSYLPQPQPNTPVLPATPVGPGAALISACPSSCGAYLVTSAGATYRLPTGPDPIMPGAGLSPDGRWLTYQTPSGFVLRDLTGGASNLLHPAGRPQAWSPNSRWLLFSADGPQPRVAVLDMRHLSRGAVAAKGSFGTAATEWTAAAILDDGRVLASPAWQPGSHERSTTFTFGMIDAASGAITEHQTSVASLLGYSESMAVLQGPLIARAGDEIITQLPSTRLSGGTGTVWGDVVVIDGTGGRVVQRYRLPVTRPGNPTADASERNTPVPGEWWLAQVDSADGLVLERIGGEGVDAIELLDLRTGDRTVVCRWSEEVNTVLVRGMVGMSIN